MNPLLLLPILLVGCVDTSPWYVEPPNFAPTSDVEGSLGCSALSADTWSNTVENVSTHDIEVYALDEACAEYEVGLVLWGDSLAVTSYVPTVYRVRDARDGSFLVEFVNNREDAEVWVR